MVRRFFLAISLCVALLLSTSVGSVNAQVDSDRPVAEGAKGYQLNQDEVDAYHRSVSDCSSPSLECLVKNTTRFVAIEWIMDIAGPGNNMSSGTTPAATGTPEPPASPPAPGAGGSLNSISPVAARSGGAISGLYQMIGSMYSYPPANTYRYVADVMDNAGMAPTAYAQGLGFASLDPILSLWKSFRNIAYFFFIVILITIGIMIMLRQKISAQASVTAQQALPGIIISLILVTFSYAIAGLLIDVMYLSMYLIAGLFDAITKNTSPGLGSEMINMNIFQLGQLMFVGGVVQGFNNNANLITSVITGLIGGTEANGVTSFLGFIGGLTISIVIAVVMLISTFKLFLELLKSYASIIMGVVFGPIYLMLGAIPGKNAFTPWFKNLVGNLAAFPATLLFLVIFKVFTENLDSGNGGGFMPPYLIGNGQSGIAGYIMGFAILLALPDVVKEIKKNLGAAEGGFGWMVVNAANKNFNTGVRYSPWMAGTAGSAVGAAEGLVRPFFNGTDWKSPQKVWDSMQAHRKYRGMQAAEPMRNLARGYEQIREGKAVDPNAWENALVEGAQDKRKKALEAAAAAALASRTTPIAP